MLYPEKLLEAALPIGMESMKIMIIINAQANKVKISKFLIVEKAMKCSDESLAFIACFFSTVLHHIHVI